MDPQFEELARRVATEVVGQLSPKLVDDVSDRVIEQLSSKLVADVSDSVIERLSPKLTADVTESVVREASPRIALTVADKVEKSLEGRMQIHFERMEGLVKVAAEGYGATLGSIDRRLTRLEKKWDTKISDHDQILGNHNQRISSLEQKRR